MPVSRLADHGDEVEDDDVDGDDDDLHQHEDDDVDGIYDDPHQQESSSSAEQKTPECQPARLRTPGTSTSIVSR